MFEKRIEKPKTTSPVLMKNSVRIAGLSHLGTPTVFAMRSPMSSAQKAQEPSCWAKASPLSGRGDLGESLREGRETFTVKLEAL